MQRDDELKLDIMSALRFRPMVLLELVPALATLDAKPSKVLALLEELIVDGYVASRDDSSTVARTYQHASETSLSDMRGKLLPHRDPVRAAHEDDEVQQKLPRKRQVRVKVDVDDES